MATFESADTLLQDVASEIGLGVLTAAMSGQDVNSIQLRTLLKRVGRGLVRKHQFLQHRRDFTVVTTEATTYALPADFLSMVDGTGWNDSQTRPLQVVTPQVWARLVAENVGAAYAAIIRPGNGSFEVWPQPPQIGETIRFEFYSRNWVQPMGQTAGTSETPTAGTDLLLIDSHLLGRALRHAWLVAKSMPQAVDAYEELREALETELGLNAMGAPDLSLNGGWIDADPLIGVRNLPSGGVGAGGGLLQSSGLY